MNPKCPRCKTNKNTFPSTKVKTAFECGVCNLIFAASESELPDYIYNDKMCTFCGYRQNACICEELPTLSLTPDGEDYLESDALDNLPPDAIIEKVIMVKVLYSGEKLSAQTIERLTKEQRAMLPETIEKLRKEDYGI